MTKPGEVKYGGADIYCVQARNNAGEYPGVFCFSEKFLESENKRFDAILLLGAHLDHDKDNNQDSLNSWMYSGFSKKARAISRLFIKSISIGHSIPNFLNMGEPDGHDYTGIEASFGTTDHGDDYSPELSS